jgi:hypothetical protein
VGGPVATRAGRWLPSVGKETPEMSTNATPRPGRFEQLLAASAELNRQCHKAEFYGELPTEIAVFDYKPVRVVAVSDPAFLPRVYSRMVPDPKDPSGLVRERFELWVSQEIAPERLIELHDSATCLWLLEAAIQEEARGRENLDGFDPDELLDTWIERCKAWRAAACARREQRQLEEAAAQD